MITRFFGVRIDIVSSCVTFFGIFKFTNYIREFVAWLSIYANSCIVIDWFRTA